MDKAIVKRALIILGSFLIVILLAVGCTYLNKDEETPTLSNGDTIYFSTDDYKITYQDLYDEMLYSRGINSYGDGLTTILDLIDAYLLSEYIEDVTQAEIDKRLNDMIYIDNYKNLDEYELEQAHAALTDEDKAKKLSDFQNGLLKDGYKINDTSGREAEIKLDLAKEAYAYKIISTIEDDTFNKDEDKYDYTSYFVDEDTVYENYLSEYFQDAEGICIKFNSQKEAETVLQKFNLVTYNDKLALYIGAEDIADVKVAELEAADVDTLTNDEVFDYYVRMYNYIHSYGYQIPDGTTATTLTDLNNDNFYFVYDEVAYENSTFAYYMASYIDPYDKEDAENVPYMNEAQTLGDNAYLFYKVAEDEKVDSKLISQEMYDFYFDFSVKVRITDTAISEFMKNLHQEKHFTLYDEYLSWIYNKNVDNTYKFEESSKEIIASVDGYQITPDQLFNNLLDRLGPLYTVSLAGKNELLNSTYFETMYDGNTDYLHSNNELTAAIRNDVRDTKTAFSNDQFKYYGYSVKDVTWEEFMFAFYNVRSVEDAIRDSIISNLSVHYLFPTFEYNKTSQKVVEDNYNNYFNLTVEELHIYLDINQDGIVDNYDDYLEGLNDVDKATYNVLRAHFENDIVDYLATDNNTLETLVSDYNDAMYDEDVNSDYYSVWAPYKNYGFLIEYNNVENGATITHKDSDKYESEYAAALKDNYDIYTREENKADESMLSNMITTVDGIYILSLGKGEDFEQPSAVFQETDINNPKYSVEAVNEEAIPSENQIKAYIDVHYYDIIADDDDDTEDKKSEYKMPLSVFTAVEAYYGDIYNSLYSNYNYSLLTIQTMNTSGTFATNDVAIKESLNDINDYYFEEVYTISKVIED